jgi:DNA-binding CsgD family transcriptional regulator
MNWEDKYIELGGSSITAARLSKKLSLKVRNVNLSPQQYRVFELLLTGRSNKEIQTALNITERTAKEYAALVYRKFDVRGRLELLTLFGHFEVSVRWVPK